MTGYPSQHTVDYVTIRDIERHRDRERDTHTDIKTVELSEVEMETTKHMKYELTLFDCNAHNAIKNLVLCLLILLVLNISQYFILVFINIPRTQPEKIENIYIEFSMV